MTYSRGIHIWPKYSYYSRRWARLWSLFVTIGVELQQITYSSSVDIRPEWGMVEQIQFAALGKLSMPSMEGEEVRSCGSVQYYDKAFDRVVPKNERPLKRTQRVFRSVTTSDDPVIR